MSKIWMAGLGGGLLAAAVGWALHDRSVGSGLVNLSYDVLTIVKAQRVPTNVVLVVMNEASHEKLGQRLNAPWNRALHAELVDKLTAAGATAIVFDVVFNDPTSPQADQRLARAVSQSKRVILAADHERLEDGRKRFAMPLDGLREAAAGVGSAEVIPARDLIVREHTPGQPFEPISTLSWVAAQFCGAPVTRSPGAEASARWMQYYAPPNLLPSVSYEEVISGTPAEVFRDKVVFVGARIFTRFAGERKDEYKSPYSFLFRKSSFIAGVEIQATAFLNLMRGDWWSRLALPQERALIILFGAVAGYSLMQARPWSATALGLGTGLAVMGVSLLAVVQKGVWFPWLILVTQLGLVWVVSVTVNSFRLYLERRLYEQTLALYLSPKLVKKFAQDKRFREPGAEKQMLTILFSDIANFTGISEGMDSDELARLMNSYFQRAVTGCIHATDGTVVKYIGDAIFAFWNAPDLQRDHAVRACEAALLFRDQGAQVVNGQPLVTRIGLHTGVANVGNFGSASRVDYTALGESINLASRMEGLNKYLGTQVLITGATRKELGEKFSTRFVGSFRLKGFEKSVEVFELIGRDAAVEPAWLGPFYAGLKAFMQRDFALARMRFSEVLDARPDDGPATFYLHKIVEFNVVPPPESWRGEVELREK